MDLTTATPVEIDTILADLYERQQKALVDLAITRTDVDRIKRRFQQPTSNFGADSYHASLVNRLEAQIADLVQTLSDIADESQPYANEYLRRGGWTRAFLVRNANGHVHRDMSCQTCRPTTVFAWMVEYSGMNEAEIVEAAGERACTVCYPSAPVEVLSMPTKMFTPEEVVQAAEREERALAKVERDAKKAAKAIFTDDPERALVVGTDYDDKIKTLAAARAWLTDEAQHRAWGWKNATHTDEQRAEVAAAVAAKENKTVEVVLAEADKRAAKRK